MRPLDFNIMAGIFSGASAEIKGSHLEPHSPTKREGSFFYCRMAEPETHPCALGGVGRKSAAPTCKVQSLAATTTLPTTRRGLAATAKTNENEIGYKHGGKYLLSVRARTFAGSSTLQVSATSKNLPSGQQNRICARWG
jgi:hypothetical protein